MVLIDMASFSLVMTILSFSNRNSHLILTFQLKGPLVFCVTIVTNLNSNSFQIIFLCCISLCTGHFCPLLFHCFHLVKYICGITNLSWRNISLLPVWLLVQCIPGCPKSLDPDFQLSSPPVLSGEDCVMRLIPAYTDFLKKICGIPPTICHRVSCSFVSNKNIFFYKPATQLLRHSPVLGDPIGFA